MMIEVCGTLLVIALFVFGVSVNSLRRLTRDFAYSLPFGGELEPCLVQFATDEARTDCLIGANDAGLYLSSSIDALRENRSLFHRYHVITTPLLIPWEQLKISKGRFPMRKHLLFTVKSSQASFFVPRETGDLLLQRAGRPGVPD